MLITQKKLAEKRFGPTKNVVAEREAHFATKNKLWNEIHDSFSLPENNTESQSEVYDWRFKNLYRTPNQSQIQCYCNKELLSLGQYHDIFVSYGKTRGILMWIYRVRFP